MVQMRVITKTSGIDKLLQEFPEQMDELKRDALTTMAADIALNSPVWSGEYVTNHQLRLRSGSFTPSKPGVNQGARLPQAEADQKVQQGLNNLLGDIAAINIKSENFVFRNRMLYAGIVEGDYGVYAQARKKAAQAVQQAVEKARRRG